MSATMRDNLIMTGLLAAMAGGSTAAVFLPQHREVARLRARTVEARMKLVDDARKVAIVPQMVRQVEQMKQRYSNFDRRLPQRKELGGFLREISGNLSQEQLSNQLIEPGQPARERLFHTLPIILRFRGSYPGLASFLVRLRGMERLTQVERLSVNNRSQDSDAGQLDVEVRMNIYFTES